jgi:hypothetical protein
MERGGLFQDCYTIDVQPDEVVTWIRASNPMTVDARWLLVSQVNDIRQLRQP